MSEKAELVVENRKIQVSNLDKVLYPKVGFTKGQVIDYYIRVAPVLLPHLKDRPLTMKRYPNGVEGEFFYEKNCPSHRPKWVKTAEVWSEGNNRMMDYCLAQDLPTLVWAANLADLELHTSLARKRDVARPTMMVFDLDPGAPADIVRCCQVSLWLRDLLARMKLKSFAKSSGSKGLQVYVPLNTSVTFDQTKDLSRALAQHLEHEHADLELHTSLARKRDVARPTMMVFDLDPGAPANIVQCSQVGLWLRDLLAKMKLKSFAKTSGSKGLQVYVPLNTSVTFDQTKDLSRALAQHLEHEHADLVTSNMSKALRKGKVFVDWSQNDEHKTTICVYSLRAKKEPTVSTPVTWDEVENCLKKKKADLMKFRSDKTLGRVEKLGDLFASVEKLKQKLPTRWKL